ncbi:MAG: hypothetical protein Q3971_07915 [Moraxella sp.]|nr:hypothetical protein [Moraxella sp.]
MMAILAVVIQTLYRHDFTKSSAKNAIFCQFLLTMHKKSQKDLIFCA